MTFLFQCVECSEKREPEFAWLSEESAKRHVQNRGQSHAIFIKAEAREFEIKVVDYEP